MAQTLTQHECLGATPFCSYDYGERVKAFSYLFDVLSINMFLIWVLKSCIHPLQGIFHLSESPSIYKPSK